MAGSGIPSSSPGAHGWPDVFVYGVVQLHAEFGAAAFLELT